MRMRTVHAAIVKNADNDDLNEEVNRMIFNLTKKK